MQMIARLWVRSYQQSHACRLDPPSCGNRSFFAGCGNAFCGAFLAAVQGGETDFDAAVWGCVAASFMAESYAIPQQIPSELHDAALLRVDNLRRRVKTSEHVKSC